jgi:inosose dehydratase
MLAGMAKLAGGTLLSRGLFGGPSEAGTSRYAPKLSVQAYIWIQQFQSQKKTIGEGVEEALAAIHQAGYRRVELLSDFFQPDVRAKTLALLAKYELEPATTYAGGTMHEAPAAEKAIAEILELARVLKGAGTRWIVTNPSPKPRQARKSDEELNTQARYLNQLAGELHKLGVGLMIHHHTPELVDNAREWRHLLGHTDPQLVFCCVDVNWAVRGGQDALAFLRKTGDRLVSLHLRNDMQGVWMEDFGPGDIDYQKVADYLKQINFNGYLVVELAYEKDTKIARSLEEDLRLSKLYAERVFGL